MASYVYDSMRPYQREGSHFVRRNGSVIIADQPGLGKTIQSLGAVIAIAAEEHARSRKVGEPWAEAPTRWHLVVTPNVAIKTVWEPEIRRWLRDKRFEVLCLTGSLAERQKTLKAFKPAVDTQHVFVVCNIESVRIVAAEDTYPGSLRKSLQQIIRFSVRTKDRGAVKMAYVPENGRLPGLFDHLWDTVICDESHRALIRTKHVPTQTRAGFMLLRSRRRLALSGTPMRGKPEQLWGTLNWLRPDLYRSYWNWAKNYFEIIEDKGIPEDIGGLTESGKARLARDLQTMMLRRTKAEVAPDLPPKTYAGYHLIEGDDHSPLGIWLPMEKQQAKQYDRLLIDGLIGDSFVNGPLAMYTRQRQIAGCYHEVEVANRDEGIVMLHPVVTASPKFEWLTEWLSEHEEKIIVVSQYTSTLKAYEGALDAMGVDVVSITGRVTGKNREVAVDRFQNGDAQVMLLNIQAGGVALTLDAADYVVFLDETTVPDESEQAEDRAHRISRLHNVTIYYLRTLGTIEEEVAYVAAARQDVQQYLLDGARGVEYARQIYLLSRERITA